ncbi:hypothetical protein [Azospirillum thermophilum]|uniref:Uncharacterized protein n=1 Tax=Azospirillum thermophilum TaxID=2202148 RepID=A0A2S2CWR5_9PROT|nr:hypothetical protein [Azospirillum thermophilum]AWK88952.1 hypothetical protein DEW08_23220 [Azospirillum thermophilum]
MPAPPLDDSTLDAIGVLIRAVEQARVPGVLEFRLLINALRRAAESRDERELQEAGRVFETIDPEFRARIAARATAEALAFVGRGGGRAEELQTVTVEAPKGGQRPGSSFLAAINGIRGAMADAVDSRETAKARLIAAVEQRRAAETTLIPGDPLPRSP